MEPLVSIVIPTFNRAGLVGRALDSVLSQAYRRLEVIVVDDGSTDETHEVLRRYVADERTRVVRLPENRGVTAAKNAGLAAVGHDAKYVGILDSDDLLVPGAVGTLMTVFEENPGAYSQVFGWCTDLLSGQPTGRMTALEGPITYDDALSGRFAGEFWQLADLNVLGDRRFDDRASGAESSVWWPMLRDRPGWLVPDVVRRYDARGDDRVSIVRYSRAAAAGRMWACQASLTAYGADLRRGHPERYRDWLIELAKWAALADESHRARAAVREALRYGLTRRALLTAGLTMLPARVVRQIAAARNRARAIGRPASGRLFDGPDHA